jgi:hypothetical protein
MAGHLNDLQDQRLVSLDFMFMDFSHEESVKIGEAIAANTTLRTLRLINTPACSRPKPGAKNIELAIVKGLVANSCLTELDLESSDDDFTNNFSFKEVESTLAKGLVCHRSLQMLSMDCLLHRPLGSRDQSAFSEGLACNTTLRKLAVWRVHKSNFKALSDGIRGNTTLVDLFLQYENDNLVENRYLADALAANQSLRNVTALVTFALNKRARGGHLTEDVPRALANNPRLSVICIMIDTIARYQEYDMRGELPQLEDGPCADLFLHSTQLSSLTLENMWLAAEGPTSPSTTGQAICSYITENTNLTSLKITNCEFDPDALRDIAHTLSGNNTLMDLNLSNNHLGDDGVETIANAVKTNSTLTSLCLSSILFLDDKGAVALSEALCVNTSLRKMWLCDEDSYGSFDTENTLGHEFSGRGQEGITALANILKCNTSLEELFMCRVMYCSNEAKLALSEGLGEAMRINHNLKRLHLAFETLPPGLLTLFFDSLGRNKTLKILEIDFSGPAEKPPPLTKLRLGEEAAAALRHNTCLEVFVINCGPVSRTGMKALAEALRYNRTLKDIAVSEYKYEKEPSSVAIQHFAKVLKEVPRYQSLELRLKAMGFGTDSGVLDDDELIGEKTASLLGLCQEAQYWTVQIMVRHFERMHWNKFAAFVMGQHDRLGAVSHVRQLSRDTVTSVFEQYFGLPSGHVVQSNV